MDSPQQFNFSVTQEDGKCKVSTESDIWKQFYECLELSPAEQLIKNLIPEHFETIIDRYVQWNFKVDYTGYLILPKCKIIYKVSPSAEAKDLYCVTVMGKEQHQGGLQEYIQVRIENAIGLMTKIETFTSPRVNSGDPKRPLPRKAFEDFFITQLSMHYPTSVSEMLQRVLGSRAEDEDVFWLADSVLKGVILFTTVDLKLGIEVAMHSLDQQLVQSDQFRNAWNMFLSGSTTLHLDIYRLEHEQLNTPDNAAPATLSEVIEGLRKINMLIKG